MVATSNGTPNSASRNGTPPPPDRLPNGRFVKGCKGGPGRKPVMVERTYLAKMIHVVTADDWEAITERAVADAKRGDATAREWLSKYLLGQPQKAAPANAEALAATFDNSGADEVTEAMLRDTCERFRFKAGRDQALVDALRASVAEQLGLPAEGGGYE
jgi:hypothetical protein